LSTPDVVAIRAILEAAGAPVRDLEWLVASCPTVADARGYHPPAVAWCPRCGEAVVVDSQGCVPCRIVAEGGDADLPAAFGLGDEAGGVR
jgi:hypothetical protein